MCLKFYDPIISFTWFHDFRALALNVPDHSEVNLGNLGKTIMGKKCYYLIIIIIRENMKYINTRVICSTRIKH